MRMLLEVMRRSRTHPTGFGGAYILEQNPWGGAYILVV